jgi:hypothetical protein
MLIYDVEFKQCRVNMSLCLTKHYSSTMCVHVDLYIHVFLTSIVVGGEWSAISQGMESSVPIG